MATSLLALLLALLTSASAAVKRPGQVQFSNGDAVEGTLSLTPGADLRLHLNGNQIRVLDFERVREIRVAPAEEQMVQKWRFLEAGQTKKEFSGKPYLIRNLQATVFLAGGEKITGHLYTTVLYLEDENGKARKIILPAKQRGQEGEGANALVFPSRISFSDAAAVTEETIRLRVHHADLTDKSELAAVTWEALFTFAGKRTGQPGEFKLASPLGRDIFLGFKTGNRIVVGWPKATDAKCTAIVQANLANNEDFFDDRKLLGVFYDEPHTDIYSLLILHRQGQTTMDGPKTQPWRLVILRWKFDPDTQRVLLAGRGTLFRGLLPKGEALPAVTLADKLWKPKKQGEVWMAGD